MASKFYREPQIAPANVKMVGEISDRLGLEIPEDQQQDYVDLVNEVLSTASIINDIPQPKPEVAFPRTPGYRPHPKDNPYNAWYVKTEIQGAPSGLLAGKRIAIKDNVAVAGVPMMNGTILLEGYVPDCDATIVTRILQAGGTIAGKAACENMCYAANSFTSATGPILNPLDTTRSAGGSSSGCAALLSAGDVDLAIGGDQGGSIRMPASCCGIVGLKPTFSLVPFTGSIGLYPQIDHVGPMARTVADCALLLQVIAGPDPLDFRQSQSLSVPNFLEKLDDDINGMKIALLKEGFDNCTEEEVKKIVKDAANNFENLGCTTHEISIPFHKTSGAIFEHLTYPGIYETVKNGGMLPGTGGWHNVTLGATIKQAVREKARHLPSSMKMVAVTAEILKRQDNYNTFAKAVNLVPVVRKAYDDVLKDYDVIIMPTLPCAAPKLPNKEEMTFKGYFHYAMSNTINTGTFNLTGHPAISINAGYTKEFKLPVGMMIIGKHFDDATVLRVARALEKATEAKQEV